MTVTPAVFDFTQDQVVFEIVDPDNFPGAYKLWVDLGEGYPNKMDVMIPKIVLNAGLQACAIHEQPCAVRNAVVETLMRSIHSRPNLVGIPLP